MKKAAKIILLFILIMICAIVPVKAVKVNINYSEGFGTDFNQTRRFFCINHGNAFSGTVTFETDNIWYNLPDDVSKLSGYNEKIKSEKQAIQLQYILSEMSADTSYKKLKCGNSKYQIAVWMVIAGNTTRDNYVEAYYNDAVELYNNSLAYYTYKNNGYAEDIAIVKDEAISDGTKYGPFYVYYNRGTETIGGKTYVYGTPNISLSDGTVTDEKYESKTQTVSGNTYNYRTSFYIEKGSSTSITITATANTARTAQFKIYDAQGVKITYDDNSVEVSFDGEMPFIEDQYFIDGLETGNPGPENPDCPFCGSGNGTTGGSPLYFMSASGSVLCIKCNISFPDVQYYKYDTLSYERTLTTEEKQEALLKGGVDEGFYNQANVASGTGSFKHYLFYVLPDGSPGDYGYIEYESIEIRAENYYYGTTRAAGSGMVTIKKVVAGTRYYQNLIEAKGEIDIKTYTTTIDVEDVPTTANFTLKKVNSAGTTITSAATFTVAVSGSADNTTPSGDYTTSNGQFSINNLKFKSNGNGGFNDITLTITEKTAPNGYKILSSPITVTLKYNATTKTVSRTVSDPNGLATSSISGETVTLTVKNTTPKANITLEKVDSTNTATKLSGAEFSVAVSGAATNNATTTYTTDSNGKFSINGLEFKGNGSGGFNNITLTITETKAPSGYKILSSPITVTLSYSNTTKAVTRTVTDQNGVTTSSISGETVTLTVKNTIPKAKITLNKIDSLTKAIINGTKFEIKVQNVANLNDNYTYTLTTANSEPISVSNLEFEADGNGGFKNIIITITETEVPDGYRILSSAFTVTLSYNDSTKTITTTINNPNAESITQSTSGEEITITAENTPIIEFDGIVWLDGQTGVKPVSAPNGRIDATEQRIANVRVYLYKSDGTKVAETKTDSNGAYSFKNVAKLASGGYYIVFEYDGVNYIRTIDGDSEASEVSTDRTNFNNKFTTITNGKTVNSYLDFSGNSNIITAKTLTTARAMQYTYANNKSTLNTKDSSGRTIDIYRMFAKNGTALNVTSTVDLGLTKRGVDLSLGQDVEKATVTINGKTTTYTYDQILSNNGTLVVSDTLGNDKTSDKVRYNLYLYASDYNYRIDDYVPYNNESYKEFAQSEYQENTGTIATGAELEVDVTYKVVLNNQSAADAKVNSIIYYYDSNYTFVSATYEKYGSPSVTLTPTSDTNKTIDGKTYKSLTISGLNTFSLNGGEQNVIYLRFKVNKNSNDAIILANYKNIAEITSYSTTDGLVDQDSAPGNAVQNSRLVYEDDTDEAGSLNITVPTDYNRQISGYVFEDEKTVNETGGYKHADGLWQNGETKVNGVAVQLIEIKVINGKTYEYIWQETVSGGNTVKILSDDGTSITTYNVTNGTGEYKFIDFIPGNYIVRFIYGDGTITNANLIYNEQDYKSTIDTKFSNDAYKKYYNQMGYANNASVARDNEARRLEVMSNGVIIDKDKATNLRNHKEWMCSETSQIVVAVDANTTNYTDVTGTTTVTGSTETANQEYYKFTNINFGLEERPETKIILEKHVTALRIKAADGTTITDAKIDISNLSGTIEGIREGLSIITGDYWKLDTNIEEIIQGASIEAIYTFVVRNESEIDYLSKSLQEVYNNNSATEYTDFLKEKSAEVKDAIKNNNYLLGTWLGETYYTGKITNNVAVTKVNVTEVRDFISNKFDFEETAETDFTMDNALSGQRYSIYNEKETIEKVVKTKEETGLLAPGEEAYYSILLGNRGLSSNGDLRFDNFGEIVAYTNSSGRMDPGATPGDVPERTQADDAPVPNKENVEKIPTEHDEAWAEKIVITKPTGEDQSINYILIVSVISGILIVAVGTIVIRKIVLK